MTKEKLLQEAVKVAQNAYAPYSKFPVGAALLTKTGEVFTGCNVENASYGLTNCAERVAIGKAISEGYRDFSAMALSLNGGGSPCGACRQVLNEFAPELIIYLGDEQGTLVQETTIATLLPDAFGPKSLRS